MSITQIFIWILIAAVIGVVGELLARRRAPDGIVGAIVVGFIAIVLIVGVFHFSIPGEPKLSGVPLISSIIVAAILVGLSGVVLRTDGSAPTMGAPTDVRVRSPTDVVATFAAHADAGSSSSTVLTSFP